MRVTWLLSDLHACGYVRGEVVAREVNRQFRDVAVVCKGELLESDLCGTDVLVFQRAMDGRLLGAMRSARNRGVRCVYELDDDLWAVPEVFGGSALADPEMRGTIAGLVSEADAVTVSTPALGERVAKEFVPRGPVWVLRNALDAERWELAHGRRMRRVAEHAARGKVTVGWMASRSHAMVDAGLVLPAIERVMQRREEVRLHLIGCVGDKELPAGLREMEGRVRTEPWVDVDRLPEAMGGFDVGVAALADNAYNRGKSGVKALQYWALGVPVLASRLPMYEELAGPGLQLVDGSVEAWTEALWTACGDAGWRALHGAAGRVRLLEEWDLRRRAGDWVRVWRQVAKG